MSASIPQQGQDRIWEHFQNEGVESFQQSAGRLKFLANKIPKDSRVLDIGVGNGVFESFAVQRGLDIHCLDPSERSIHSLQRRYGLGEKAKVGYSQSIPFDDNSFDYIVVSEVLEHLTDEILAATLDEVHRVLVPGGRLLGTVPSREVLEGQQVICPCCAVPFHRWGHMQTFTPRRMHDLLSRHLVVERLGERPFVSFRHLNWKGKIASAVRLMVSHLGIRGSEDHLWFVACKAG
ncbi:MAG: methyltransferase domain-containing protein [Candidatus Saccharimonas sp.]|nr:methyltransferase domain-containing protein [Planctomycetaceae bacterium]